MKQKLSVKHGFLIGKGDSPLPETYVTWLSMKQRCTNPNHNAYCRYGGRGITICERWMCFKNFLEDMGVRPKEKTLDRKDNSKGYYKENCKWSTRKQQANNTRGNVKNKTIIYQGTEYKRTDIIKTLSKKYKVAESRLVIESIKRPLEEYINELEEKKYNDLKHLRETIIKEGKYAKRNQLIIDLRLKYLTLKEIGEKLGLTRERVRQIIKNLTK